MSNHQTTTPAELRAAGQPDAADRREAMDEYVSYAVGASTWRVRPGSIGEAMAVYAARLAEAEQAEQDRWNDLADTLAWRALAADRRRRQREQDRADLARWETDGGAMYAAAES